MQTPPVSPPSSSARRSSDDKEEKLTSFKLRGKIERLYRSYQMMLAAKENDPKANIDEGLKPTVDFIEWVESQQHASDFDSLNYERLSEPRSLLC